MIDTFFLFSTVCSEGGSTVTLSNNSLLSITVSALRLSYSSIGFIFLSLACSSDSLIEAPFLRYSGNMV